MDYLGSIYRFVLKEANRIIVTYNSGTVEIRGAVRNPGPVQDRKEAIIDFYIRHCGGYQANADLE